MKDYIITIQELLSGRNEDFDRAVEANRVKLVRHKDNRKEIVIHGKHIEDNSIHNIYKYNRSSFIDYQSEQSKDRFNNVDYIVSFLGEKSREARFVGVYKNKGLLNIKDPDREPYNYDLEEVDGFEALKEKVIIDWGKGAISWHQLIFNQKYVIRIEKGLKDEDGMPYFKSYNDVNLTFEEMKLIFESESEDWKVPLQSVHCIYMIVDQKNGKQYIGSTYANSGGIWNRWGEYVATGGHGGDIELEKLLKDKGENYAYNLNWIILETLSIKVTPKEAIERENLYKEKFLTRKFGYNAN